MKSHKFGLTVPQVHASVSLAAIAAGKHVYSKKPLAVVRDDGRKILAAAREKGVRVGCAPDTFLGGGLQTCRKLIDDGWIGEPVAAAAFLLGYGPESWHPNPALFYQRGAGPMFDMGPYYLTTLIHLLGPVKRVTSSARATFPERIVTSEARYGERLKVEVATHVLDIMQAFEEASQDGRHVEIESRCDRPAPLPLGLPPRQLDA